MLGKILLVIGSLLSGLFACPPSGKSIVLPGELPAKSHSDILPALDPNSTLHLERRYMYQQGTIWPDNTFTYCFENAEAENAFSDDLRSA
jgi:hypothetical protein